MFKASGARARQQVRRASEQRDRCRQVATLVRTVTGVSE
jgi:hypothetical protein